MKLLFLFKGTPWFYDILCLWHISVNFIYRHCHDCQLISFFQVLYDLPVHISESCTFIIDVIICQTRIVRQLMCTWGWSKVWVPRVILITQHMRLYFSVCILMCVLYSLQSFAFSYTCTVWQTFAAIITGFPAHLGNQGKLFYFFFQSGESQGIWEKFLKSGKSQGILIGTSCVFTKTGN